MAVPKKKKAKAWKSHKLVTQSLNIKNKPIIYNFNIKRYNNALHYHPIVDEVAYEFLGGYFLKKFNFFN